MKEQQEQDDESVKQIEFQQWLQHPTTVLMLNALKKHRSKIIDTISNTAASPEYTDSWIRHHAVGLRCMDAVIKIVTDKETMITLTKE